MSHQHPAAQLLITVAVLLAGAAQTLTGACVPLRALPLAPRFLTSVALDHLPLELVLLLSNEHETNLAKAKRRAEEHLIDFVELMWPVIEREQPFVRTEVQEAICMHLEAVTAGLITNLLGNVPPGSTKSYLVNVFWPAWEWGPKNRPDLRYMSWSYDPNLTLEANDACRKIIESEVYQRFWGNRFEILKDTDAKGYYRNDKGGWRRSSSIKGGGTGYRADRLIWDDPISVKQADSKAALTDATRWFARTLPTRVRNASRNIEKVKVPYWVREVHGMGLDDDPDDGARKATISATVGIMQRLHPHDPSGIILRNPALGYEVLLIEMRYKGAAHPARNLPTWRPSTIGYVDWRAAKVAAITAQLATLQPANENERSDPWSAFTETWVRIALEIARLADPIRFPEDAIRKLEAQLASDGLGADAIAAQLDQWPIEGTGQLFTEQSLPIIEPDEVPTGGDAWRGWDWAGSEASNADRTASAHLRRAGNKRFYLMHTKAMRGGPAAVDKFIAQQHADDPKSLRWSLPKDPGALGPHWISYVTRTLCPGRTVRSSREEGKEASAGPVASQAASGNFFIVRHPGCEIARQEMIDFPYGDHDDIMDAISRAFGELISQTRPPPPASGMTIQQAA